MDRRRKLLIGGGVVVAVLAAGGGVAAAGGEHETPIVGAAYAKATAAALASTGGGRVTGTEAGDEESAYQVEVTLGDGRQVDVQLDDRFRVVGSRTDREAGTDPGR